LLLILQTDNFAFLKSGKTSMQAQNKLSHLVQSVEKAPAFCRSWLLSQLFGRTIKFAGTAGVQVVSLDFQQSMLKLANKKRVQNHIGGIHAAAMALLGESASGFLVGMHVPDDRIPLLKSMDLQYVKRATGDLTATARLSDAEIQMIRSTEKGEVTIQVELSDSVGVTPVMAEFVWAWVPKVRKPNN
jgi:acyl-coenzyme A thioesterase PaaI-like protein